ncbi:MAG: NUDIX domain-containing protein [Chloroflexota bacterium]|nr:MAG: NUDIX domain-containing protein [Chloroflexota bacterium]
MIVGTNGIVLDENGRILLIRRDDILTWALPGGALEPAELPTDGVVREVEEETGQWVVPRRLAGVYYWTSASSAYLIFAFLCRPAGGEVRTTQEALQVGYYRPDRLPWPILSLHRERIEQALNHAGGPPRWGRQHSARWLRIARRTIGPFVYLWQDLRRFAQKLPPYEPPRPWHHGAFTIIRDDKGRVLWVKRTDHDVWNLPGGRPEVGETPWETAVRETREETGLAVRLTDLSGVYVKPAQQTLVFTFLAEVIGGELTTGPESAAFDYFPAGQEPENSLPKHVRRSADATTERSATLFRIQDGRPGLEQLGLIG